MPRRELAGYLVSRLRGKRPVMYEVATREMPGRSLLCLKRNVDEQEMWAFGKEFIAILRERPLPEIEGREGAAFCIWWGLVNADGDGPIEWCAPVPAAQAESLASHRSRSTRGSVLPSRPKTSACASPISPAHWAPRSPTATRPFRFAVDR
jgi:hypothetical protein